MSVRDLLARAEEELRAAGVPSPEHDARALAAHLLGLRSPAELALAGDLDEQAYQDLVRRRAAREPLQHIVGTVGFRYLELQVGPGVFVPRPESEVVAQAVIDGATSGDVVVELCAGSGAIALSVAKEVPGTRVHGVELDPDALEWARRNDPDGSVTWHLGRVEGCLPELDGQVAVVVSNPPYVPVGSSVERETEWDPQVALWGGEDGLDVVREVERAARRLLRPGGLLVIEHDDTQGESAPAVLEGWAEVQDHPDLNGRPRFVTARWQP